jgi:NADH-quinone oxidoreductase subunit A
MDAAILPLLLFALFAFGLAAAMLVAARVLGPSKLGTAKQMPYESGMDPIHDTRRRFDVRFHLVAIAFLVFDVELLFLYPWAVASRDEAGIPAVLEAHATEEAISIGATGETLEHSIQQTVIDGRLLIFAEVMLFIGLLTVSFVYAWRKGVFRWR